MVWKFYIYVPCLNICMDLCQSINSILTFSNDNGKVNKIQKKYLIVLCSSGVVQTQTEVMLRWRDSVWALWPLDNEETRLFLELDFPEGRRVVLATVARTGGCSSLYLYEGKLGRADTS